jgi:quercetin 2,3-dioxygenase
MIFMILKVPSEKLYVSNHGWLESRFHFSFAEYYDPSNTHFGVLRVLNDDLLEAKTGFDPHPHKDMEIISYIIDGELTHKDSMGNESTLTRGHVQYMSAGTGVYHSEYNTGNETLRLLQLWVLPDAKNYPPNYGEHRFQWDEREDRLLYMVSGQTENAPIQIHQDCNIYSGYFTKPIEHLMKTSRKVYLVLIEGSAYVNQELLESRDAIKLITDKVSIQPEGEAHILFLDMAV